MSENRRDPNEHRDDIATLMRLARKRSPVPGDRAKRVREAARQQWRQTVGRHRRARIAWTAAAAAVVAALAIGTWLLLPGRIGSTAPPGPPLLVEAASGRVWAHPPGAGQPDRRAVGTGERVPWDWTVETGETGLAALRLVTGHSVRLRGSTVLTLAGDGGRKLERGTIYVDSGAGPVEGVGLVLTTRLGTVRETGTQYEVRLANEALRVRLREGSVEVRDGRQTHVVAAGFELAVDAGGTVTRREIETFGRDWDWLATVTPMLDLDGRTAHEFLEWFARERGLRLAYASDVAARAAADTVLAGASSRLTMDDVLDAVLPTCRMVHEIDDRGVLLVDLEAGM